MVIKSLGFNIGNGTKERNVLLVAPRNPVSFWSFDEALKIAGKRCAFQPAGLLTVAGMMPDNYNLKLVDTNVTELGDGDIEEADAVVSSGMIIHFDSTEDLIERANRLGTPIFTGGPLATQYADQIRGNATFFQGEAETGFVPILENIIEGGYVPERKIVDMRKDFRTLSGTPAQRFDLLGETMDQYSDMAVQITRGCPEKCTFCNIPALFGSSMRLKDSQSVVEEFNALYDLGWNGPVMITDDNMVGNQEAIVPRLEAIAEWQQERGHPFPLFGQVSLRMYENPALMEAMRDAGFCEVFMGLESPSPESLRAMGGQKNLKASNERGELSMLDKVREIQRKYFRVMSGFILGTDKDPDNIAGLMKDFITESRIGIAMVGPLGVLPDTLDWTRYKRAGRLVPSVRYSGASGIFDRNLSFIPHDRDGNEIDPSVILERHRDVVSHINSPEQYFARTIDYLRHRERKPLAKTKSDSSQFPAFFRSLWNQGVVSNYKGTYWKFLANVLRNDSSDLADAIHYAAQGDHFIKTTDAALRIDDYATHTETAYEYFTHWASNLYSKGEHEVQDRAALIRARGNELIHSSERGLNDLHAGLRKEAEGAVSKRIC